MNVDDIGAVGGKPREQVEKPGDIKPASHADFPKRQVGRGIIGWVIAATGGPGKSDVMTLAVLTAECASHLFNPTRGSAPTEVNDTKGFHRAKSHLVPAVDLHIPTPTVRYDHRCQPKRWQVGVGARLVPNRRRATKP